MSTEYSTELSAPFLQGVPPPGESTSALNVKRLIRLRGTLMAFTGVVIAIPLVTLIWVWVPAEYEAFNFIAIQATRPGVLREGQTPPSVDYNRYVSTQVALIKGPTILSRVLNDPVVRDLPWIKSQPDPLHFLMKKVDAVLQPSSELIRISCRATDREAAVMIVSKIVETYVKYVANLESEGIGQRRKLLIEERDTVRQRMEEQRARIAEMKRAAGVTLEGSTPLGEIGLQFYHDRLGQAQAEFLSAQTAISKIQNLLQEIEKLQARLKENPYAPMYEMGIEEKISNDPTVQTLRQQEATLARRIAEMETKYVADAPPLKAERESLVTVQRQLEETQARLRQDELNTIHERQRLELATAQKQLEDAQSRVEEFKNIIQQHEKKLEDLSQAITNIEEEEAKLEQLRREYDQFVESIRLLEVEERAPGRVTEPSATVAPERPHYGKKLQLILLALVFAGSCGVALGIVREVTDQHIRLPQDIRAFTDLPILAAIPLMDVERLPQRIPPAKLILYAPHTPTADQYRRIITRVVYPPEGSAELNTVLVTSPSKGDGKTSLACNLAVALAQADRRVLLIDTSARSPSVEPCFGLNLAEGLQEILEGIRQPQEVLRETGIVNLALIGPGLRGDVLTAKLASREFAEFLEEAERNFDHVIIDTPPALLMSDAKLLAPLVDGVILVVGCEVSTQGKTRRCIAELRQIGTNLVGIVLNKVRPTRWGYMKENLEQFYAYGTKTPVPSSEVKSTSLQDSALAESGEEEYPNIILLEDEAKSDTESTEKEKH